MNKEFRNVVCLGAVLAIMITQSACKLGGDDDDSSSTPKYTSYFDGTWIHSVVNCILGPNIDNDGDGDYAVWTFIYKDGVYESRKEVFDDVNCTDIIQSYSSFADFTGADASASAASDGTYEIDLVWTSAVMTPHTTLMAQVMDVDVNEGCAMTGWEAGYVGKARDVSAGPCNILYYEKTEYQLRQIIGDDLYYEDPATGLGTSAAERPTGIYGIIRAHRQ